MANKEQDLEYIRSRVPLAEQLAVFAEEAAEAAQAALKYRRKLIEGNPTPVSIKTALGAFLEELGDIQVCYEVMGIEPHQEAIAKATAKYKTERWANRLHEEEAKQKESAGAESKGAIAD